jgi:hypothetical protein
MLRQGIRAQESKYKDVKQALDNLDHDLLRERANLTVGQYYCFFKGQWDRGLPMLARADDSEIADLAQADLNGPSGAEDQVRLGDRWWNLAERFEQATRDRVRMRAVHWYRLAFPQLPAGLLRSKTEIRIREADKDAGRPGTRRQIYDDDDDEGNRLSDVPFS